MVFQFFCAHSSGPLPPPADLFAARSTGIGSAFALIRWRSSLSFFFLASAALGDAAPEVSSAFFADAGALLAGAEACGAGLAACFTRNASGISSSSSHLAAPFFADIAHSTSAARCRPPVAAGARIRAARSLARRRLTEGLRASAGRYNPRQLPRKSEMGSPAKSR